MKILSYVLASALALSMMAGCGADDNSDITPAPSASPNTSQGENNVNMSGDTASDAMDDMGDAANSMTKGAGNAVKDAAQGVENAVGDMTGNRK